MLQKDILHIGLSPSIDQNIKKWWCNISALYVKCPLKHTKNSRKTQKCLTPGHFVGAEHASK